MASSVKVDLDYLIILQKRKSMSQDLHQPLMTGGGKSSDIGVKQFSRWAVGIFFLPREYTSHSSQCKDKTCLF